MPIETVSQTENQKSGTSSGSRVEEGDYQHRHWLSLATLILYGVASRVYLVLRYSGLNIQGDGSYFTRAAESVLSSGSIVGPITYQSGFGYPTFVAFVSEVTGISPLTFQLLVAPLLGTIPLYVAYALFRNLLGKTRTAFVALVVLAIMPDFLSITSRGTHETLTITLFIVGLLTLFRIMFLPRSPGRQTSWMAAWWIALLGSLTLNIVFAYVTLIVSIIMIVLVGMGLSRLRMADMLLKKSWWSFVATGTVLTFFYAWYVYPPASGSLVNLHRNLLFVSEILTPDQVTAYKFVQSTWSSIWVYAGLTFVLWLVLIAAATVWVRRVWVLVHHKMKHESGMAFMLAALAVLGFALGLSVAADFTSSLGNTQYRMLPLVLIISVPLAMVGARQLWRKLSRLRSSRMFAVAVVASLVVLSTASLLKTTTDPAVSKYWSFYSPEELLAVRWSDSNLRGKVVWADVDSRILRLSWMYSTGATLSNASYVFGVEQASSGAYCYAMDSTLIEERLGEYGGKLVLPSDADTIYQNGDTRIYWLCST